MKSYGVRLGAGAVTLLFGAYAAAIAQKDRQDESISWSAETPELNEPAAPIAEMSDDSWLKQPATALAEHDLHTEPELDSRQSPGGDLQPAQPIPAQSTSAQSTSAQSFSAPSIQLVQHAEDTTPSGELETFETPAASDGPTFAAGLPATLGVPSEVPPSDVVENDHALSGEAPDMSWMMPDRQAAESPAETNSGPAMSMTLPVIGSESNADAASGSDELVVAEIPSMEFYPAESINAESNNAESVNTDAPTSATPPANLLRGTADGDNVLRLESDAAGHQPEISHGDEASTNQLQTIPNTELSFAEAPEAEPTSLSSEPRSLAPQSAVGFAPAAVPTLGANASIEPAETLDAPGERRLEGAQTPSIVIQKRAPAEVKVGKPASFVVQVQNVGAVEALNVAVHDQVPAGMRLVDASPTPVQQGSQLLWQLGSMPAGDERTITMQLIPEQEGELGSVARVSFEAAASVRTVSTRPELKIVQRVPEQGVLIGQQLEIELEVSNPGSGAANNVVLQEDVPEGLDHPKGRQLDNALGTLAPGEVRRQVLRLRAVAPGVIQNTIRLLGEDGLSAEHTVSIQVVAPNLEIELSGPSKRFLERQATYQLNIANNGTADATNIEISVLLSRGFTFVSTDYEGQYDPTRHSVFWSLAQLPAGAKGTVPLTLLPVETGEQLIKTEARADLGVVATNERKMTVDGFAELSFAISNAGGPIEVGAETSYEIVVTNSGSKPDSNVRVQLQLPPGLELISSSGDAQTDGRGTVIFPPRPQLAPREELKYGLRVRGTAPGTHIVRAVVVSDHGTVPVTKEESTRVYADQ
jgi:uncharacterized repeat protein (TIGR01451 family)